ncbi:hypothetical protein M9H77_02083 [Catharanthus roseus]|uniref:Uncharacterized protein n=1 Tax=Catharanthus roseus TaxID=4058 RepID=A0ACC0C7G6_CATRO|nr:hypothetical protein M9H77_02083 [Catharanthus roseus]
MVGEQPIRPRKSLALGLDDCILSPLTRTRYFSLGSTSTATSSATPGSSRGNNSEGKGNSGSDLEVVGATLLGAIQDNGVLDTGFVELVLFAEQYNEKPVKEFYANLTEEFGNSESPAYGQVCVRGHVIDFSLANIAHYLSCPHNNIEGTGLEEKVNFDEIAKVLTGDAGAIWPETNKLH